MPSFFYMEFTMIPSFSPSIRWLLPAALATAVVAGCNSKSPTSPSMTNSARHISAQIDPAGDSLAGGDSNVVDGLNDTTGVDSLPEPTTGP
jgi:hypothetical protein